MNVLQMWSENYTVKQIAIRSGDKPRDVVAYLSKHHRYVRSPLPVNTYEQVNRMRRKANEVQA